MALAKKDTCTIVLYGLKCIYAVKCTNEIKRTKTFQKFHEYNNTLYCVARVNLDMRHMKIAD